MSWFTRILALISHSQQSHGSARATTWPALRSRLGVESLDERSLPSATSVALVADPGTHLVTMGHAKAIPQKSAILFPICAQADSFNPRGTSQAVTTTAGQVHTEAAILFPVFAQ
jgi:hypothetical protein